MIKRYLDKILITLGCLIIIIAISLKVYTQYEQKKLVDDYRKYISDMAHQDRSFNTLKNDLKISETEKQSNNIIKDDLKTSETEKQSSNTTKDDLKTAQTQKQVNNIIGILSIPKIDLSVGIGEGVDKETLKYSVGHFEETALPGKAGNLCIIGHRSYTYGQFFNRLDEIEKNDYITVESYGNIFKYKVTEIKVVTPDQVSVLNQTEDSAITLITCTPMRIGSHRLIVKGVLVEGYTR